MLGGDIRCATNTAPGFFVFSNKHDEARPDQLHQYGDLGPKP